MAQGPLQAARRLAGGLAVQPSIKTLTQRSSTGTFLSIENSRPRQPPPSVREGRGNGGGTEGERTVSGGCDPQVYLFDHLSRSEERRVGKECRSRWSSDERRERK